MTDRTTDELLTELILNMVGLRAEIEGWRRHTSSGSDFVLSVLESQTEIIRELAKRIA